jgi:hypothetical protein
MSLELVKIVSSQLRENVSIIGAASFALEKRLKFICKGSFKKKILRRVGGRDDRYSCSSGKVN